MGQAETHRRLIRAMLLELLLQGVGVLALASTTVIIGIDVRPQKCASHALRA